MAFFVALWASLRRERAIVAFVAAVVLAAVLGVALADGHGATLWREAREWGELIGGR